MEKKLLCSLALLLLLGGCSWLSSGERAVNGTPTGADETIALPSPQAVGRMSVEEAIARRRSVRDFTGQLLTERDLSQLLWATQGITDPGGLRAAPSAGALYPLEVYVAIATGLYHYLPEGHRLSRRSDRDLRAALSRAALSQEAVRDAPAVFVIAAVPARTEAKYGARAGRYVDLEAGHAAENLLLQAVALGLGGVPIGAFTDSDVQRTLGLPAGYQPLLLIPVGHPA